jgi:hypothetical protein
LKKAEATKAPLKETKAGTKIMVAIQDGNSKSLMSGNLAPTLEGNPPKSMTFMLRPDLSLLALRRLP